MRSLLQYQDEMGLCSVFMRCKTSPQHASFNNCSSHRISLSDSHLFSAAHQQKLPAGKANYCDCAGGPHVSAASAPLLTHSPTSSSVSSVMNCAYTTQPTPGWTPSIITTSISTSAPQRHTSLPMPTVSSTTTSSAAPPTCTAA